MVNAVSAIVPIVAGKKLPIIGLVYGEGGAKKLPAPLPEINRPP